MLKDKDISQRTLGFISFSFLAHIGLIAATFLIPNVLKEVKQGSGIETILVEAPSQASLGESAQAGPAMMPMTAPVDDASAIAVPAKELPQKSEVKPEAKLIAKKAAPAREKVEAATKKVLALPSKKAALVKPAQKVETVDQSDIEVSQALKAARESEESLPEVAADIEVPEVNEEVQAAASESSEQTEETPVEAAAVVSEEPAVESATTTSNEEASSEAQPEAQPVAQPAPQPLIAPIQRGARLTQPSGQVGGLGTAGAPASPSTGAGGIRDADSLSEQPGNAKPTYLADDQRAGRQGTVIFNAMVTKDGSVQAIQMKQSSGHSSLDSSAYEAFKQHRYLPGQQGAVQKTFQFVLNGEETVKSRLRRR